ncbi:hypothetical protein [Natrarchaeobaculum aegyptiacum]|uniref:Uncharacterized protein n=1 Tax=Natrarchaeobaculum aegyptiacum TaxID=745377 RepID=A0A2Z2HV61_9EURY|nr:hypothetical protein [Natrarchaeobaculum aegyptiacum]ARS90055.1 hypothetical protein B1756_10160 [Natrarchaeobaculum aegyptiacum]
MKERLFDTLHQPEYTGENRCEACTVVNVGIAAVLGALVARKSKLAAAVTLGIAGVVIYLRGYLVPGTPTLTKRYLPPAVLRLFGKEPEPATASGFAGVDSIHHGPPSSAAAPGESTVANQADPERAPEDPADRIVPEEYFLEREIVEPCEDVDDLCLTGSFESAWVEEIDRIDADALDADDAVAAIGLDDDATFEIERHGDGRVLRTDDQPIGQWPSQAALVADVAAARVLENWDDEWASLAVEQQGALLNGLRLFLETCPTTGGEVALGQETVESCCQSYEVVAVTCTDTDERLFEHPVGDVDA